VECPPARLWPLWFAGVEYPGKCTKFQLIGNAPGSGWHLGAYTANSGKITNHNACGRDRGCAIPKPDGVPDLEKTRFFLFFSLKFG
jgi:hypothetical protein